MIRRSFLLALVTTLSVLPACGDSTGPGASAAGTYALSTVGDEPLPFVLVQFGTNRIDVTAGS